MPLIPGEIFFGENGIPTSPEYGDVYHTTSGGLEQARKVFMQGCDLPAAWQDQKRFVILETGFGLGLNFLATWLAFREQPGQCQTLHFISIEKHPLTTETLARCHTAWPELAELAQQLRSQWPVLVAGYHRLSFDAGRVQLTLIFDDAEAALKQLDAKLDAIYLDGFSPAKNPAIWSPNIMQLLARLAAPNARLATWCVAGAVRQALQQVGFEVERKPGFGHKKERLEAHFTQVSSPRPQPLPSTATLIGAGIAGTSLTHALIQHGWQVTLIDRHPAPAMGASGNPAGVVRPQLTLDESLNGRLSRQAFLHTTKIISAFTSPPALPPSHAFEGVLHLARNDTQAMHMQAMLAAHRYPPEFVRWVTRDEASRLAGMAVTAPGLYFPQGGWMSGARVAQSLLAACGSQLTTRFNCTATRLEQTSCGWRIWNENELLAETDVVVLTGAHEAAQFTALPLEAVRGQITLLPDDSLPDLALPITREGYVLPTRHNIGNIGASFAFDNEPIPRAADQNDNLQRSQRLLEAPPRFDALTLDARVSFRAATPDRLPLVGAIANTNARFTPETTLQHFPRRPGLFALTGLGARGLTWAPFLATALAAKLNNEAWHLPQDLWHAIDPARFSLRKTRRAGKN